MKQGCPLSPTLFGIFIDELESFLRAHTNADDGCLLHKVLISILLFADDVILLASIAKGLQHQLDALADFCTLRQLSVNLAKIKVMVFNTTKEVASHLHFHIQGRTIEITTSYVYLGVLFTGPTFQMKLAAQSRICKGYAALSLLERSCFRAHFKDIPFQMKIFDTLVRPTITYGSKIWGPSLGPTEWSHVERV